MKIARCSLLVVALLASIAFAADAPPPDVDAATAKKALARFKTDFDTVDIDLKITAVKRLGKVPHKSVAAALLKKLKKSKDAHVRAAAVAGLGNQHSSAKKAGGKIVRVLEDRDEEPRVVLAGVRSIGKLHFANKKSKDVLVKNMENDEDQIVASVFTVYGNWKDASALDDMQTWWDFWRDEKGFQSVSVNVDTGTAGGGDQAAAAAAGAGQRAKLLSWRHRPICTKALRAALTEITGVGFVRPEDLRRYIDDPKNYKDPTKVAERVPEDQRREIYKAYQIILSEALSYTDETKPEDPENKSTARERGKIYKNEVYKGRRKLADKREVTVSELLVIRNEGDDGEWPKE